MILKFQFLMILHLLKCLCMYEHGQWFVTLLTCTHLNCVSSYRRCAFYEEERTILYNRLREQLGIHTPNVYTLLGYDRHREISTLREQIMQEVGQYNKRTERFKLAQAQNFASQLISQTFINDIRNIPERIITEELI